MSLPSERTMPTITATWNDIAREWSIVLPGNITLRAPDEGAVAHLVSHHAPGSAIRWIRITEAEHRLLDGNR